MATYRYNDVLAASCLDCSFPGLSATATPREGGISPCASLYFPGCSFVNYALDLVDESYRVLREAGRVDGISLLCCGKILEYDKTADAAEFEGTLAKRLAACGVKRIVTACPNCVQTLRWLLAASAETAHIDVVPLVCELVDLGLCIEPGQVSRVFEQDEALRTARQGESAFPAHGVQPPLLAVHDSCPDRATGEFADGLRAIMPASCMVEPAHTRKRSFCCGSRPNAVGKHDAAARMAAQHAREAREVSADGMVTACMSCAYLLTHNQKALPEDQRRPVFHYLEFLFGHRIDWYDADKQPKLRFLLGEVPSARRFMDIDGV